RRLHRAGRLPRPNPRKPPDERSSAEKSPGNRNIKKEKRIYMDRMLHDIARALAAPQSRREAVPLVGGGLAAARAHAFGIERADAQTAPVTCSPACGSGKICCPGYGGAKNFCSPNNQTCCGNKACGTGTVCCGETPATSVCCNKNQVCVHQRCTASA